MSVEATKSPEEYKALIHHINEEVWSKGNLAAADEFLSPELTHNMPGLPPGLEGVKQMVTMTRTAFPDVQSIIDDVIVEGDKVAVRWTVRGTHRGELRGMPPTGKQVTLTGITISRFTGGRIVESRTEYDRLGMYQQLGLIPAPEQARG